jgi:hypothetical protein
MVKKILFLLLVCSVKTFAQTPGYMGKRFSIGYSNYFFPAIIGPNPSGTTRQDKLSLNTAHSINIEYTIKPKTNFCFSYQWQHLGVMPNRSYPVVTTDSSSGSYNTQYFEYNPAPFKNMQLKTNSIGIGFKFFGGGILAPVGKYKKLELLLLFSNLTYPKNAFYISYSNYSYAEYTSIGTGSYNFKTFAITYTMGRSRVLFDKLVLDYGLRIGALPAGFFAFINSDEDFFTDNPIGFERGLKQDTNMRLLRQQLINFHIGIGFLAF